MLEAVWRKLSDNQRLLLMNETSPREQRVRQPHTIHAIKSLTRLGLIDSGFHTWSLTEEARELATWARESGHAQWTGEGWNLAEPERFARSWGKIDPRRLAELAEEGLHGAEIARRLGVSPQAVGRAAQRHRVQLARRPKKPVPPRRIRTPRTKNLTVKVSDSEMSSIREMANARNVNISDWVRELIAREVGLDREFTKLATEYADLR